MAGDDAELENLLERAFAALAAADVSELLRLAVAAEALMATDIAASGRHAGVRPRRQAFASLLVLTRRNLRLLNANAAVEYGRSAG